MHFSILITRLYKDIPDLEPVFQLRADFTQMDASILEWARETMDLLCGSPSVAIAAPSSVLEDFALSALSSAGKELSRPIARLVVPNVNGRALVELARRAPGLVAVPAVSISLGTNFYEMGNEMKAMLAALSDFGKHAIFIGTYEQLQSIFHGGQGGMSDPLSPVVRRVPEIPQDILVRFAVQSAARRIGGLSPIAEDEVKGSLSVLPDAEQIRILKVVANRSVHIWNKGKKALVTPTAVYANQVSELSETLAGLNAKPRVRRSAETQDRFVKTLTDLRLLDQLNDQLLGQDRALEQLVNRLRMEVLTRPLHQPIRYCAQGTPGTGKSESAQIIAQKLGVPHINIDAASIPDYYSAAAQLLGSGRGIVGSYQSGRLEQAAKHHTGALIEVSDLDHANERVRSGLADLFLQVLETGEAQSAAGAVFSCANLIFAFTMNLPDGMDEAVRKGIGFNQDSSRDAITAKVVMEIKKMLSSAFLSRIGTPILFEPLNSESTAAILERAIQSAVVAAAKRLRLNSADIIVESGLGAKVISSLRTNLESFGARALLEYGRSLAADAVLRLSRESSSFCGKTLLISAGPNSQLSVQPV